MLNKGCESKIIDIRQSVGGEFVAMNTENNNITNLAHSILNNHRRKLISALMKENGQHISQLAQNIAIDRSKASYHLSYLEEVGIVDSEYKILEPPHSKGTAARVFTLNLARLEEALEAVNTMTGDIKKGLN